MRKLELDKVEFSDQNRQMLELQQEADDLYDKLNESMQFNEQVLEERNSLLVEGDDLREELDQLAQRNEQLELHS